MRHFGHAALWRSLLVHVIEAKPAVSGPEVEAHGVEVKPAVGELFQRLHLGAENDELALAEVPRHAPSLGRQARHSPLRHLPPPRGGRALRGEGGQVPPLRRRGAGGFCRQRFLCFSQLGPAASPSRSALPLLVVVVVVGVAVVAAPARRFAASHQRHWQWQSFHHFARRRASEGGRRRRAPQREEGGDARLRERREETPTIGYRL